MNGNTKLNMQDKAKQVAESHQKNQSSGLSSPDKVEVPIFPDDEKNQYPLYINGTVVGSEDHTNFDPTLFDALKRSIEGNHIRYSVPQKSRRIIFARNIAGAHARDIFEDPIENTPYTRIFLRSVDTDTISLVR